MTGLILEDLDGSCRAKRRCFLGIHLQRLFRMFLEEYDDTIVISLVEHLGGGPSALPRTDAPVGIYDDSQFGLPSSVRSAITLW